MIEREEPNKPDKSILKKFLRLPSIPAFEPPSSNETTVRSVEVQTEDKVTSGDSCNDYSPTSPALEPEKVARSILITRIDDDLVLASPSLICCIGCTGAKRGTRGDESRTGPINITSQVPSTLPPSRADTVSCEQDVSSDQVKTLRRGSTKIMKGKMSVKPGRWVLSPGTGHATKATSTARLVLNPFVYFPQRQKLATTVNSKKLPGIVTDGNRTKMIKQSIPFRSGTWFMPQADDRTSTGSDAQR